eukprot:758602-Hanusia_phi.AAC.3
MRPDELLQTYWEGEATIDKEKVRCLETERQTNRDCSYRSLTSSADIPTLCNRSPVSLVPLASPPLPARPRASNVPLVSTQTEKRSSASLAMPDSSHNQGPHDVQDAQREQPSLSRATELACLVLLVRHQTLARASVSRAGQGRPPRTGRVSASSAPMESITTLQVAERLLVSSVLPHVSVPPGVSRCLDCPSGYESTETRDSCSPCPAGASSLSGSPCQLCPQGTYSNASGISSCMCVPDRSAFLAPSSPP